VIVIDRSKDAEGFKSADCFAAIDITDSEKALCFAAKNDIDDVLAVTDYGVRTAAFISDRMKLSGLNYETARLVTDKALMRERWACRKLPIPKFFVETNYDDALKKAKDFQLPLIVKPADSQGGGSRGVKVIFDIRELREAFESAQSTYDDKRVIIEECVKGTEHSIEVIVIKGVPHIIAVSLKEKAPYPYRVDKKVIYPALLRDVEFAFLREAVEKSITSCGIKNGVAHVELALTEKGPVLFEIGARCGGGATPQIIEAYTGIPYLKIAAELALGKKVDREELKPKYNKAACYYFFTFAAGRIKRINGIEKLKEYREILDFEIFLKPGDMANEARAGNERHGFAVIVAENKGRLFEVLNYIDKSIYCDYE